MKNSPMLRTWQKHFKNRGISKELQERYLEYISTLLEHNAPVVFEFAHLSQLLGIKRHELAKMINAPESFYRRFEIPKRLGGSREIFSPYPSLLHCQKWIYRNILLSQKVDLSAHGFVPGRSIISNARAHLARKALLKMDLVDFFQSIPINWVIMFMRGLGYAKNVSYYLAALCTFEERLSQGSATSPYLSNLLLRNLDARLAKLSESYSLTYSRYADDITFSGSYIPHSFISTVSNCVHNYGLKVNNKKTRLHTKPGQRIVTGISVSGPELRLPRKTKRNLRKEVHFVRKYGFLSHAAKVRIRRPYYLESLIGKLEFWAQVEPLSEFPRTALEFFRNHDLGANDLERRN